MAKKVRSARGVEVDFDLLKVKQQIAESPAVDVAAREKFVENRLRRRTRRTTVAPKTTETVAEQQETEVDDINVPTKENDKAKPRPVKRGTGDA